MHSHLRELPHDKTTVTTILAHAEMLLAEGASGSVSMVQAHLRLGARLVVLLHELRHFWAMISNRLSLIHRMTLLLRMRCCRLFLSPYDLTPTYKLVHNKFSVKYYLNLVLVDEEDRRYFKQQEIQLYRQTDTAASEGAKDITQVGFLCCLSLRASATTALGLWSMQPLMMLM